MNGRSELICCRPRIDCRFIGAEVGIGKPFTGRWLTSVRSCKAPDVEEE